MPTTTAAKLKDSSKSKSSTKLPNVPKTTRVAKNTAPPIKAPALAAQIEAVEDPKPIGRIATRQKKIVGTQPAIVKPVTEIIHNTNVITENVEIPPAINTVSVTAPIEPTPIPVVQTSPVSEIITTINIDEFRTLMNSTLAKSTCSAEMRKGMIVALETVLYTTNRFNGTRPLTVHEIPMGQRPGANIDPTTGNILENYAARDAGTDKTRVEYL